MASSKFARVMEAIDSAHAEDPNKIAIDGADVPYELHYAGKMTEFLAKRYATASDELRIAIRAQHFRRWEVPRSSFPMTRVGYHSWRSKLKRRQADQASQICRDNGYSEEQVSRIASMIRKEDLKEDEETQVLEDVACLVFLDDQFEDFEKDHDKDKIVRILQKTWGKMSSQGHKLALEIAMSERARSLVETALASSP